MTTEPGPQKGKLTTQTTQRNSLFRLMASLWSWLRHGRQVLSPPPGTVDLRDLFSMALKEGQKTAERNR